MKEPIDFDSPVIAAMLQSLQFVFRTHGVDYFLIGAVARDIQLTAMGGRESRRKTNDVDIAVLVNAEAQFYQIKDAILNGSAFEEVTGNEIKLIYQHAVEVDILPFGAIENEHREIRLSRNALLVMDMHGFREVYPFVGEQTIREGVSLKVCSVEGLILLKLFAYADDPSRSKDISDIDHLTSVYFDLNDDEIYADYFDVMDMYDTNQQEYLQLISARVIGRKIKRLIYGNTESRGRLLKVFSSRSYPVWGAILSGVLE